MASIRLENIRKAYGENVVIKNVSLEVGDGEFVVLLGGSGCGKSTLLRMVGGLETITDGTMKIDDEVVNDLEPGERGIAFVFQNYALYPHMTTRENMAFALENLGHGPDVIKERIAEASGILGIEELLDRLPGQMSGGQRQRVAIGRAIARHPKVLLMDEPLSNLDAKLRVRMRSEIAKLRDEIGATILYVTHDQVEAMTMADRIVVLDSGDIQQIGAPLDVYKKPVNRFVAGFIGSPAMNFVEGKVGDEGDLFEAEGVRISARGAVEHRLKNYAGKELVAAVRPHRLISCDESDAMFSGVVEVIEPFGNEIYVSMAMGERSLTARLEPDEKPEKGKPFHLKAAEEDLYLFDPVSGLALY